MSVPAQVREQAARGDALIAQLFGATPGESQQQPPATQPGQPPATAAAASNGNGVDWKAEYDRLAAANRVLQGKYNAEVPRLSAELTQLRAEIEGLRKGLNAAPGSAAKPAKTAPDMTQYEQPILDLVEHMTRTATEPLQEQLAEAKKRQAEQDRKAEDDAAYHAMLNKLDRIVPNWKAVNDSQAFQDYCGQTDPASGQQRQVELGNAINRRDAADVAAFFTTFLASSQAGQAQQAPAASRLAEQQVPSHAAAVRSDQGGKRTWTRTQVREFYQLKAQGKLKHIPADKLAAVEADIYTAPAEGRVREG